MTTIIELKEDKFEHLSDYTEKILHYGGKLMQCLEDIESKSKYDEYRGVDPRRYDKDRREEDHHYPRYY